MGRALGSATCCDHADDAHEAARDRGYTTLRASPAGIDAVPVNDKTGRAAVTVPDKPNAIVRERPALPAARTWAI